MSTWGLNTPERCWYDEEHKVYTTQVILDNLIYVWIDTTTQVLKEDSVEV